MDDECKGGEGGERVFLLSLTLFLFTFFLWFAGWYDYHSHDATLSPHVIKQLQWFHAERATQTVHFCLPLVFGNPFAFLQELCENERHLIALEKGASSDAPSRATPKAEASEGMLLRKLVEASDAVEGGRRVAMPDNEVVTQARRYFLLLCCDFGMWCVFIVFLCPLPVQEVGDTSVGRSYGGLLVTLASRFRRYERYVVIVVMVVMLVLHAKTPPLGYPRTAIFWPGYTDLVGIFLRFWCFKACNVYW